MRKSLEKALDKIRTDTFIDNPEDPASIVAGAIFELFFLKGNLDRVFDFKKPFDPLNPQTTPPSLTPVPERPAVRLVI